MHAEAHTQEPQPDERDLLAALRRCDEAAFVGFVDQHHGALVRFVLPYVGDAEAAEALAQETWAAFVTSLPRWSGGGRLKTWLFRKLMDCAHTQRSAACDSDTEAEPSVDPSRFMTEGVWAGGWSAPPRSFGDTEHTSLLSGALRPQLSAALERLPPAQREVVILRDVEGFSAEEACGVLGMSEPHQRALLHRGRAQLRSAVEHYFEQQAGSV